MLSKSQINYAANDVLYLHEIREKLDDILTGYLKEQYNFEKEDREFL